MQLVEVQVKQGLLRGQRLSPPTKNLPAFDAFLGVPYAKPPVKELRFQAPQPPEPWEGARPALDHGADSLQNDFMLRKQAGSEDCLYLNVYSPQVPSSVRTPVEGAPWPVMVWFYPGGFTNGTSHMRQYAPEWLVAKGVVLVTVTYRLGALGFLSLRSSKCPGNAGLKDAVASLQWVRDNIGVFGGDPNRVTVFGCSAGGAVTELLQLAPAAKGLFQRAIMQSASSLNQWCLLEAAEARRRAFRLGEALGCSTQDEDELLAFLQKAPAVDILAKSDSVIDIEKDGSRGLMFPFLPVSEAGLDVADAFLVDKPRTLLNERRKAIASTTSLEVADADLERVIPAELGLEKGSPESVALADGIRQLYFDGGKVTRNGYWNLYSDLLFATGVVQAARIHATQVPVYFYLFCVMGRNNVLSTFLKAENPTGACHGDELGYLFGRRPPFPPEPEWEPHSLELATKTRLTTLWANFARTGVPTPAADPDVDNVEWKPLAGNPDTTAPLAPYLDIGATLSVPRAPLWEERVAFWDRVYAKHGPK
ncbi:acetylcholinesterase-like isoform X2 [Thrips palmi]|uniref:Carboxylic ester hydrolase n=1 Tax=Thrips palmi TaxID=161013 RepID=A0A6P9A075_THRPL|nr:acetylcholinesterase-like isoform X2 [Thrips palmi]